MTRDEIRLFMERAIAEGQTMTLDDWEAELERPLPIDQVNVYEGDLGMDENTARRIATALEQIALELGPRPMELTKYPAAMPPGLAVHLPTPAIEMLTYFSPPKCPIHGQDWRENSRGAYCPRKLDNGTWCNQKPQITRAAAGPAGLTPLP